MPNFITRVSLETAENILRRKKAETIMEKENMQLVHACEVAERICVAI